MKQLLLFALGLIFSINVFSQKGNVTFSFILNPKQIINANKIIKEEVYLYTFNKKGIKDSSLTNTYYYDSIGDLIEEKKAKTKNLNAPFFDASIIEYTNTYNSLGKLRRQIMNNQGLKMITIDEFEYDSSGNEINKYEYNKDTTRLTIERKIYNEKNQVIELQTKVDNFDFYISRKYYYSPGNDLIKTEALNAKGEIIYSYIYEYDKTIHKKTDYLENSEGRKKTDEYFYNDDQQCVKVNRTFKSTAFISSEYTEYDSFNQTTENIYNPDKTLFESDVYLDGKKTQMIRHFYFKE